MKEVLKPYVPVCQAIATLLQPHAEVVLHDLATGNIAYIANAFSKRRPGDSSMTDLEVAISIDSSVIGPYRKTNWDRRQLRSVTAVLRDQAERSVGLLCINLDISAFEDAVEFIRNLIQFSPPSDPPAALFKSDWKEMVNNTVDDYLRERKEAIYENLRDLNFEYRAGKMPDSDYVSLKASLEEEAAAVLAEMARLEQAAFLDNSKGVRV